MTRAEIKKKFDEIVDFAGVEKFLDTPVKRYSQACMSASPSPSPPISSPRSLSSTRCWRGGDAEFQKKCLGKKDDDAGHGRTVLFVSHNMEAVRRLCARILTMNDGRLYSHNNIEQSII